jgi:hypothetical protein
MTKTGLTWHSTRLRSDPGVRGWNQLSNFEHQLIKQQFPDQPEDELKKFYWYLA